MANVTRSITVGYNGNQPITKTVQLTAGNEGIVSEPFTATTNQTLNVSLINSQLKILYLNASADMVLKLNTTSGTAVSISLVADVPNTYYSNCGYTSPLGGANVTQMFVNCTTNATLDIRVLQDPTP